MKTYVVFDLEATCWKANEIGRPVNFKNEIIEIGAVKLDSEGNEISRFSKFAKPLINPIISNFCTELTTIKQEDIDYADDLKTVLVDFFNWCENSLLVSWGHYDRNQLQSDLYNNKLNYLVERTNNHISLKHLHGGWNKLKRGGIGLGGALKFEKLSFDGVPHRGIDDAINIVKIFKKYIQRV